MKKTEYLFQILPTKSWNKRLQSISRWKAKKAYKKIIEISKNNDYTTGKLLNYESFSKHYKLIAIDLSKQIELENPNLKQQINFTSNLEDDKATIFFIIEKSEETTFGNTKDHKLVKWFKQWRIYCASFSTCKTAINDVFVDRAEHIYIAMPMYNLI